MKDTTSPADSYSIPRLLRGARGSYKQAIGNQLAANSMQDLPRGGSYVLTQLATGEESMQEMIRGLAITKQSFSQLVDTLVLRGFIEREIDPADRRRMSLKLTARGDAAAEVIYAATNAIDHELEKRLSPVELAGLRRGLVVLGEIKELLKEPGSKQ